MSGTLGTPIQGVTLYSFTRAFHGREYDLEGLIRKVSAEGYGPGLEVIGFSSFRGFPEIDDRFAGWFRDLVDEVGLVTTSLAVNADIGIHRDRLLTQDELIEYMRRQIEAAAKLGFPIARVQISLTPDSMEQLAPSPRSTASRSRSRCTPTSTPRTRASSRCATATSRSARRSSGSPPTGAPPSPASRPRCSRRTAAAGHPRSCSRRSSTSGTTFYEQGPPADQAEHGQRFGAFIGLAAQNGRPDLGIDFGINGTGLFGPARVDDWLEIMPWIRHVHGKFFGIDENGEEPSVPVRDLIALLVEHGYSGAISSEYEGWHWNHWQSPFDIIRGEQAVQRSAAEAAGFTHDHGCRGGSPHPRRPPRAAGPRLTLPPSTSSGTQK